MIVILFGFWLLLNGQWTTEIAIVGAVLSLMIYALIFKFFGFTPRREFAVIRRLPAAILYGLWLVREIFRSAFQTMHYIWSPREIIVPKLVSFRSKLKTDAGKVILANSITMTPGTITVAIQDDRFLVHCLDETFAEGLEDSEMERLVRRVEGDVRQ